MINLKRNLRNGLLHITTGFPNIQFRYSYYFGKYPKFISEISPFSKQIYFISVLLTNMPQSFVPYKHSFLTSIFITNFACQTLNLPKLTRNLFQVSLIESYIISILGAPFLKLHKFSCVILFHYVIMLVQNLAHGVTKTNKPRPLSP